MNSFSGISLNITTWYLIPFKMAISRFFDVEEEEIDIMEENILPKGTKDAGSKSRVTLSEGKI